MVLAILYIPAIFVVELLAQAPTATDTIKQCMELQYRCLVKFVAKVLRTRIVATLTKESSTIYIQNKTGGEKQFIKSIPGIKLIIKCHSDFIVVN